MKIAQVNAWGYAPEYVDINAPEIPSKDSALVQIKLTAAGQHHLVKSRAAGKHYPSTTLPHIPGLDGVGILPSGEIAWINTMQTGGSMSKLIDVPKSAISPLPAGLDLDEKIQLLDLVPSTDFSSLDDVDVILDYIYGPPPPLLSQFKRAHAICPHWELSNPGSEFARRGVKIEGYYDPGLWAGSWKVKDLKEDFSTSLYVLKDVRDAKIKFVKLVGGMRVRREWCSFLDFERVHGAWSLVLVSGGYVFHFFCT